ncbi:MAG: aminopeptidase P family protein [Rhodospirillales bacterium]|jgi:Xaa-Pro aminopeptidase|nr:aminopeptidase P family protein [Rhodospirillales bacterium]
MLNKLSWTHELPAGAKPTRELLKYMPQLSLTERDRRWEKVRKKMVFAQIDALIVMTNDMFWDMGTVNLRYLTQIGSKIGAHAAFFLDRDPIVWNALLHMNRPTSAYFSVQEWVSDVRPNFGPAAVAEALREAGLSRARIGLVGFGSHIITTPTFLHGHILAYQKELPDAQFLEANGLLEEARLIKSDEELSMLAKAGQIARKTVDTIIEFSRPGVTEAELYAEIVRTQIANGCEPQVFHLMASGPVEHPPTEIWHLLHGSDQPAIPSMRPLQQGDIVLNEFHTQYGGYLAATEFTTYVGKQAPKQLLDIHKVCVECLHASAEALVPGNTVGEAWEAVRKPALKAELDFVELGFHGHGLASPEFPCVVYNPGYGQPSMNGAKTKNLILEEGMVLGNNIDLFNPAWKPDVGCVFGDMMVVRKGGAQKLVNVPLELPQNG